MRRIRVCIARRSDISDHLATIFSEAVAAKPRLIVELGVRGGESRYALERAARVTRSYTGSLVGANGPTLYMTASAVARISLGYGSPLATTRAGSE